MHTFDTPEPISVALEVAVANVDITASDRTDTVVDVLPTNENRKGDVATAEQTTVDYTDGLLRISTPNGWRQWRPWGGRESVDVRIALPSGSDVRGSAGVVALRSAGRIGELRFKAGAGNVHVDHSGPLKLSVGAGDIDVGHTLGDVDVKTTGTVRVGTVDGTAVIKNSNGDTSIHDVVGDLRVHTANGNVVVDRARATVAAKSANGDVRLDAIERGRIVAETARGTVEVGIRAGVAAWLDLNTAFGTVRNDLDAAGRPEPGDDAVDVRARTAFGDITIRRAVMTAADDA
jgi:DUF4097 and DUF4098 domain-containing protein YvlB